MLPIINICNVKIITFPIILILAVCICIITLSKKTVYHFCKFLIIKSLLYVLPFALLGGKLLYSVIMVTQGYRITFKEIFFSGFVFYGGLIGGIIGLIIFSCSVKIHFLDISDIFSSILPLGQAIGRIGCFFNGCCYGIEYSGICSVSYPVSGEWISVFPTWFAEAFICLLLFIILQKIILTQIRGICTGTYLSGYAVVRFILEFFRGDSIRGIRFGLSTSQIISLVCLIVGAITITVSTLNKITNKITNKMTTREDV